MSTQEAQRRLAAILLTDMVGFSRLMQADEEGTLSRQKAHRDQLIDPKIAEYGGRIVKSTGDGLLVQFSSIVDAVRCAVNVQLEMIEREAQVPQDTRIEFRMGINLGDIVIDGEDIFGDGVNIAARLQTLSDAGGICVTRTVVDHVEGKINSRFEDLGEKQVKSIAQPVQVYRVVKEPEAAGAGIGAKPVARWSMRIAIISVIAVAATVAVGLLLWSPWELQPAPNAPVEVAAQRAGKSSIAVLPFRNMSGDDGQAYFSDGITEDIITDLSKVSGLFVIARNSSFTYKNKDVKVQDVGRELGVRHILEGSVRRSGKQVRITAQLIDAQTGGHLWAERFDRELTDIFAIQDEVTEEIVSVLSITLTSDDQDRMRRSTVTTSDAYDMLLRGLEQLRRFTPETVAVSREYFKKAIELDPNYARAHANVGYTYGVNVFFGASKTPQADLKTALEYGQKALRLDPRVPQVHLALGFIYWQQRKAAEAIETARETLRWDPNNADGFASLAAYLTYDGRYQQGLKMIDRAMILNPLQPVFYLEIKGRSQFGLGQYQAAALTFKQVLNKNPRFLPARRGLAATYAHLGQTDDAEWEGEEIMALQPDFTLNQERERVIYRIKEDMDRYISGLRMAGLPE